MTQTTAILAEQLRKTCHITGASWAVWARQAKSGWVFEHQYGLTVPRLAVLDAFVSSEQIAAWMAGSLRSGRTRSQRLTSMEQELGCEKVYLFPSRHTSALIMVGAPLLSKETVKFWQVLALNPPFEQVQAETLPEVSNPFRDRFQVLADMSANGADVDSAHPVVFDWLLIALREILQFQAGYIAVRSGQKFQVIGIWGYTASAQGKEFNLREEPDLVRLVELGQPVLPVLQPKPPAFLLPSAVAFLIRTAICLPVFLGQYLIALFVGVADQENAFSAEQINSASKVLVQAARPLEYGLLFGDFARYLQQFALLSDLATALATGTEMEVVAQRLVLTLSRVFRTDRVLLLLPSEDGKYLCETGSQRVGRPLIIPVDSSLVGYAYETGETLRVGDMRQAPRFRHDHTVKIQSALVVPLKYDKRVIGVIGALSVEPNAFTTQDEQLLGVIASHVAGLIENLRLNEEALRRAKNLSLIHHVVRRLVGLTDVNQVAQVAASLLADYFDYEYVMILLRDKQLDRLVLSGTGGAQAEKVPRDRSFPLDQGIIGQAFRTGETYHSPQTAADPNYISISGRQAGSELCVPLRDGEQILGVINLERAESNAFSHSDIIVIESLAGFLSSVMTSARQYQELEKRIEAQERAEQQLLRSARLAAIGELAAGVAHELNNPLTTVAGFVGLALDELPPDLPQREELEIVEAEAQRARQVVRRLLDFARQGEDKRMLVSLNELASSVVQLISHTAEINNIEVHLEMEQDLPTVQIDPNQMKQVILNVVQNALQAMPKGGVLTLKSESGRYDFQDGVVLEVADTGEGIPPEHVDHIFEPFFTTRSVGEGTGLGLPLSLGIVNEHGGQISVESSLGEGSRFRIWLPLQPSLPTSKMTAGYSAAANLQASRG